MAIKRATESMILKACLQLLALRGIVAWRNNSGARKIEGRYVRFGAVGSADILGVLPGGRFLAVEVKAGRGRLTEAQASWHAIMREQGAACFVVRSPQELDAALEEALHPEKKTPIQVPPVEPEKVAVELQCQREAVQSELRQLEKARSVSQETMQREVSF